MELEAIYLFSGVVIVSLATLFVIRRLFKSKSYEDVLAEQRLQTNALYSNQPKPKLKDKKLKKAMKKQNKDKKVVKESDENAKSQDSGSTSSNEDQEVQEVLSTEKLHHVEFKESPAVIQEEPFVHKDATKRKQRVLGNFVKPILLNRDSSENVYDVFEVPAANHFEQSHPKDEVELFNSFVHKDEKKKPQAKVADKKTKQQVNEEDKLSKIVEKVEQSQTDSGQKKSIEAAKKSPPKPVVVVVETKPLTQNGAVEKIAVVKEPNNKKKKKSEFNMTQLTQQNFEKVDILNQLINMVNKTEMSKGDVQTLINVLLNKQQDAPVVEDWSEGKGDPVQKLKKQLAEKEKLIKDFEEIKLNNQTKLREIRSELNNERSQNSHRIRDLEETLKVYKMEVQNKEKQYTNVFSQYQQISAQYNEEIASARDTREEVNSYAGKVQELERANDKLQQELNNMHAKRSEDNHSYIQLKIQNTHLQEEMENKEMILREFKSKFDQNMQTGKIELQETLDRLRLTVQENQNLHRQLDESSKHHINESRVLKNELQKLQEQLNKYSNDIMQLSEENNKLGFMGKGAQQDNQHLQEEIKHLREELKHLRETQTHGSIEIDKLHKSQVSSLNFELSQAKNQAQQLEASHKTVVEELKKKHDAELEQYKTNNDSSAKKLQEDSEKIHKDFLRRVFPSVLSEISSSLSHDEWLKAAEEELDAFIKTKTANIDDNTKELLKLKEENENYKSYMEEVEGILLRLQSKVGEEEKRCVIELKSKDECIAELKQQLAETKKELDVVNNSRTSCVPEKSPSQQQPEAIVNNHTTNGACLIDNKNN